MLPKNEDLFNLLYKGGQVERIDEVEEINYLLSKPRVVQFA
jgi:hypothetical protein